VSVGRGFLRVALLRWLGPKKRYLVTLLMIFFLCFVNCLVFLFSIMVGSFCILFMYITNLFIMLVLVCVFDILSRCPFLRKTSDWLGMIPPATTCFNT
jgi:hypothetical protein